MTVLTESFTQADSTTLGPDQAWTEEAGNVQTVGGAVQAVATGTLCLTRLTTAQPNVARSVSVTVKTFVTPSSGTNMVMACCRGLVTNAAYYGARILVDSAGVCTVDMVNYFNGSVANTYGTPVTIAKPTAPFTLTIVHDAVGVATSGGAHVLVNGTTVLTFTTATVITNTTPGFGVIAAANVADVEIESWSTDDHNVVPTSTFICGAECGIAVVGALTTPGVEHWSSVTAPASVVTSGPASMRSTRAFRFNPSTQSPSLTHTFTTAIASPATMVARFYVYFATVPNTSTGLLCTPTGTYGVAYHQPSGQLRATNGSSFAAAGIAVTTGQWYRVDTKIKIDTTRTVDLSVDGVATTQFSEAGTAAAQTGFMLGSFATWTGDVYFDDVDVSGTSADYPIGAGTVAGLYPTADKPNSSTTPTDGNGGHLYTLTTSFGKGAGGATNVGAQNAETTSWQSLQNPLSTTIGSMVTEKVAGAGTQHMVWRMGTIPADATTVNGVMVVAATHSATATANTQSLILSTYSGGGGSPKFVYNLAALNIATITFPIVVMPLSPAGAGSSAWTVASVNDVAARWGDSNDVNPVPSLDGVCLEVDYVPAPPVITTNPPPMHRDVRQAINRASFY